MLSNITKGMYSPAICIYINLQLWLPGGIPAYTGGMLSLYDLILFFCLVLGLFYWWQISGQKTFAMQQARRYCRQRGIQLLDQTLAFKTYRLQKDKNANTRLCRVYGFDFCQDGATRRQGEVSLSGRQLLSITLEDEHLEITQY